MIVGHKLVHFDDWDSTKTLGHFDELRNTSMAQYGSPCSFEWREDIQAVEHCQLLVSFITHLKLCTHDHLLFG